MRFFLVALVASAGLLAQPADARSREEREVRQQQRAEQPQEPQREERSSQRREHRNDGSAAAARQAQQRNGGGRVLSVEPDGSGYRVKVLKDGEVRTHRVEG